MKKIILLTALSTMMVACGGDKAETTAEVKAPAQETAKVEKAVEAPKAEKAPAAAPAIAGMPTPATAEQKADIDSAKQITKAFGGALKKELMTAMKAGGPISALEVCNEKAIPITTQSAKDQGAEINRVSLKNRNPDNVPNAWQAKILSDFDKRAAAGESIETMAFAGVVENNGKKQLHFMKALPTGKTCLSCHGSELGTNVSTKIKELYPEDKAVGYAENQVRGAIVVVKDIK